MPKKYCQILRSLQQLKKSGDGSSTALRTRTVPAYIDNERHPMSLIINHINKLNTPE